MLEGWKDRWMIGWITSFQQRPERIGSKLRHFQENNPSGCGLDLPIQTERVDDFIFCNTLIESS